MNKKGFTLIEVVVSITLVSVVMVFMLASLVKLRDSYAVVHENTDALLYSSSVSRILNNDISENGGIRYVSCNIEGDKCDIVLANNKRRRLIIYDNEISPLVTTVKTKNGNVKIDGIYCDTYLEADKNCTIDSNNKYNCECPIKNSMTTLKYLDTTNAKNTDEGSLIYIKSLTLTKNTDVKKDRISTSGYTFGKMTYETFDYESVSRFTNPIDKTGPYRNTISSINIGIYDGIDVNDNTYGISIYSSSNYPPGMKIGDEIVLTFDNTLSSSNIKNLTSPNDELVVKYGVNFNVYIRNQNGKTNQLREVTKIEIPSAMSSSGTPYKFMGYYTTPNDDGIQVVDESGNIVVNNTYFIEYIDGNGNTIRDRKIYAKWN